MRHPLTIEDRLDDHQRMAMPDDRPSCCIFTVVFGEDRDLAARTLWSYRHQNPDARIVAACLGGATAALERASARHDIDLLDLSGVQLTTSHLGHEYAIATLSRFIDVPPLLPAADLYVMVDADTVCLQPLPVDALWRSMVEHGQTFAAAPEVSPLIGEAYLAKCRRIVDLFQLRELAIDASGMMVNAGVVAWRAVEDAHSFPAEYAACLRYIEHQEDAEAAIFFIPGVDQLILNVLARRHADGRFHLLDPAWNERRALWRHGTLPDWPTTGMRDALIWHCRDSLDALYTARYPAASTGMDET